MRSLFKSSNTTVLFVLCRSEMSKHERIGRIDCLVITCSSLIDGHFHKSNLVSPLIMTGIMKFVLISSPFDYKIFPGYGPTSNNTIINSSTLKSSSGSSLSPGSEPGIIISSVSVDKC